MKTIRLFFCTLCVVALGVFSTAKAANIQLPAGLSVAVEIETRHLTKEQAQAYVASGDKVTLDVYLVLKGAGWASYIQSNVVTIGYSRLSYALFDNTTYTLGQYLPDPTDHILICVNSAWPKPANVPNSDVCRADDYNFTDWYVSMPSWQLQNGGAGLTLEWPTYAYSVGNDPVSSRIAIAPNDSRVVQDGDNIKVRLYQLQFILKDATRDYPVGLLDENFPNGLNGSHGAAELNIKPAGNDAYVWPGFPTVPGTGKIGSDWTDCRGTSYFEFINGGLFIQTGPEVETFEPYFAPGFNTSFCPGDSIILEGTVKLPNGAKRGDYFYSLETETGAPYLELPGMQANNTVNGTGAFAGVKMWFSDGSNYQTTNQVKVRVAIPSALYEAQPGGLKAVFNNKFKFAVYDKSRTDATAKEFSSKIAEPTVAQLPKLYVHVGSATNTMTEDYDRKQRTPYDTIGGMAENAVVYLKPNCTYGASHPTFSATCYRPKTADGVTTLISSVVR